YRQRGFVWTADGSCAPPRTRAYRKRQSACQGCASTHDKTVHFRLQLRSADADRRDTYRPGNASERSRYDCFYRARAAQSRCERTGGSGPACHCFSRVVFERIDERAGTTYGNAADAGPAWHCAPCKCILWPPRFFHEHVECEWRSFLRSESSDAEQR